ncbi:MAG: RNA 2',3'-cyclic phosphodiesterase, partial [Chitinispirillia bacterium]
EHIQNICYGVKNARWIPKDQMHLTLRFIGECDSQDYDTILSQLSNIAYKPFSIRLEGVGHFPPRKNPRILWIGIKPNNDLKKLRTIIDKKLEQIGIPKENKKFHPHITVARLRNNTTPATIIPFLTGNSLFKSDSILIKNFHLFSSILRQEGASHQIEQTYGLKY